MESCGKEKKAAAVGEKGGGGGGGVGAKWKSRNEGREGRADGAIEEVLPVNRNELMNEAERWRVNGDKAQELVARLRGLYVGFAETFARAFPRDRPTDLLRLFWSN